MDRSVEIGVDVGGTFTDVVLRKGAEICSAKVASTPRDPAIGIMDGIRKVLAISRTAPGEIKRVVHGSTVALNAIIERKGATIGLLMTKGFEDTLALGRQNRSELYNLFADPETPEFLAPRRLRIGINERIGADGNVIVPLDEEQVETSVRKLKELYDVKAVAICYLHSYKNPGHELRTKEIIRQAFPDLEPVASCEVDPLFREYERLCLTVFDAYIRPLVSDYLGRMEKELAVSGIEAQFQLIQSRGGITSSRMGREKPINLVRSGPAAGVIAANFVGQTAASYMVKGVGSGKKNFISIDIGGASSDVALVKEGNPLLTYEATLDKFPIRRAMIDVRSIGAWGGSIAWVDDGGGLRVGPHSSGAEPGPACYGRGGTEATVTDASLVLGFLDPDYFAGGDLKLDRDAAFKAIESIARRQGLDIVSTALGIHKIVNSKMSDLIRLMSVGRGYDPRDFHLIAVGGAGPIHCSILAAELSIPLSIVPAIPGVLSAFGLLVADIEHENAKSMVIRFAQDMATENAVRSAFQELIRRGDEQMVRDGVSLAGVAVKKSADLRYVGQSYELEIDLAGDIAPETLGQAVRNFHAQHELVYGYRRSETPLELVNLRTVHSASFPPPLFKVGNPGKSLKDARKGSRTVYFGHFVEVPVYERKGLPALKESLPGPAIIEQHDSTTIVYPGQWFVVDPSGNIIISNREVLYGERSGCRGS